MAHLSLRARALACLARREYSREELARKLARHAEGEDCLRALLDILEAQQLLSNKRFVESVVQRRRQRFGVRRIAHELGQHDIDPVDTEAVLRVLRETEVARAAEVWRKRFGHAPEDGAERARQYRFLAQRGFEPGTIEAVFRSVTRRPG